MPEGPSLTYEVIPYASNSVGVWSYEDHDFALGPSLYLCLLL